MNTRRMPPRPKPAARTRPIPTALEWAEDTTGRCARITAVGSRSLLVENHTGILSFSDTCVRLATRAGEICVRGAALTLNDVRRDVVMIRGALRRLDLPCAREGSSDER